MNLTIVPEFPSSFSEEYLRLRSHWLMIDDRAVGVCMCVCTGEWMMWLSAGIWYISEGSHWLLCQLLISCRKKNHKSHDSAINLSWCCVVITVRF